MKIFALLYCARSGSTFLARQVSAKFPQVCVVPEFRLPMLLLWLGEEKVRALSSEALNELMLDDFQMGNLIQNPSRLTSLCVELRGRGIADIIESVVGEYAQSTGQSDKEIFLIKNSELLFVADELVAAFPGAKFIHMRRDPRAVVNSLIRSKDPYDDNRPMGRGDPLYAAGIWKRYCDTVSALSQRNDVLDLPFEDFITNESDSFKTLSEFMGTTLELSSGGDAVYEVGESERQLHTLVRKSAEKSRVDAWVTELDRATINAIDYWLQADMRKFGYSALNSETVSPFPDYVLVYLRHLGLQAKHYSRSTLLFAKWMVADPRRARVRFQQFFKKIVGKN